MQQMEHEQHVVIGVDPHKLSATIEIVVTHPGFGGGCQGVAPTGCEGAW
jgi:hypothetical protein